MRKQDDKYLAFPIPGIVHKKFKTIASIQGKTFKSLFLELANEYFQKPENEKILANVQE